MKESENKKSAPLGTYLNSDDFLEDKDKDKDEDEGGKENSKPLKKPKDSDFGLLIHFW